MARLFALTILAVLVLISCGGALAAFEAKADGSNQSPPINTTAVADAVLVIDGPNARAAVVKVILSNITDFLGVTLSMSNSANTSASTVLWIIPTEPPTDGIDPKTVAGSLTMTHTFTAADLVGPLAGQRLSALWNASWDGQIWITVTTLDYPQGYIMQTFMPAPEVYAATLDAGNSVPPLVSNSMGASMLVISPDYTNATVELVIKDVAGYFMSHIHVGNSSTNGPILLWINPLSASLLAPQYFDVGSALFTVAFNYTALSGYSTRNLIALANLARTGGIYANVHTQTNMGGIIRGNYNGLYPVPRNTTARPAPPSPARK